MYNDISLEYDAAVIQLRKKVDFRSHPHIRPACFPYEPLTIGTKVD